MPGEQQNTHAHFHLYENMENFATREHFTNVLQISPFK